MEGLPMLNVAHHYVFGQNSEMNMNPLVFTVKTDNAGTSDSYSFTIPITTGTYRYVVDWGDGNIERYTTGATHTYSTQGIKQIKIYGTFPRFYFNNGGDRLKLLSIDSWGDVQFGTNQANAFYGCSNLTSIASGANWFSTVTIMVYCFAGCTSLSSLPEDLTLNHFAGNGQQMFQNCTSLTSLPSGMILGNLPSALRMFSGCSSLTSLPSGMTLDSLTNGQEMFAGCTSLTSLPSGMNLHNLTNGNSMFRNIPLTSLPSGMVLGSVTSGLNMFNGATLTSLPSGMTLDSLTVGQYMFINSPLTSLPSGMTLPNLIVGREMFTSALLTDLPSGMKLPRIGEGQSNPIQSAGDMFANSAINTTRYSQLLIDLEAENPNTIVSLNMGGSKYNSSAVSARAGLISRGWDIRDGGLE